MRAMEEWAPSPYAYSWDRIGLHTGAPDQEVKKAVTVLSVTTETLTAARKAKADLIVAHHPLIWEPLKSLRADDKHAALCLKVAAAGMACFSAHTNLDLVPGGVNDVLAERIGLEDTTSLLPAHHAGMVKLVVFVPDTHLRAVREAVSAAGAGVIGEYTQCAFSAPGTGTFLPGAATDPYSGRKGIVNEEPEQRFETLVPKARVKSVLAALFDAHPYEEVAYDLVELANRDESIGLGRKGTLPSAMTVDEFAKRVKSKLEIGHVRVVDGGKKKIRTVAVLGGAGGDLAGDLPDDVDAYVTGDVKYHDAQHAADRGLTIIDAGHHGTEKWIVPAMADYLKAHCKGLRVVPVMESDPFRAV